MNNLLDVFNEIQKDFLELWNNCADEVCRECMQQTKPSLEDQMKEVDEICHIVLKEMGMDEAKLKLAEPHITAINEHLCEIFKIWDDKKPEETPKKGFKLSTEHLKANPTIPTEEAPKPKNPVQINIVKFS